MTHEPRGLIWAFFHNLWAIFRPPASRASRKGALAWAILRNVAILPVQDYKEERDRETHVCVGDGLLEKEARA